MKLKILAVLLLALCVVFANCSKGGNGSDGTTTEDTVAAMKNVKITQENLDKYLEALPQFFKLAKEAVGAMQQSENAATRFAQNRKLVDYVKSKGWDKPSEFFALHQKIAMSLSWLTMSGRMQMMPPAQRQALEQSMAGSIKNLNAEEKAVLKANKAKIMATFQRAGSMMR